MKRYNVKLIVNKVACVIFASLNIFFMSKLIIAILISGGSFTISKLFSICVCLCSSLYGFVTLYFAIFCNNEFIKIIDNKSILDK